MQTFMKGFNAQRSYCFRKINHNFKLLATSGAITNGFFMNICMHGMSWVESRNANTNIIYIIRWPCLKIHAQKYKLLFNL